MSSETDKEKMVVVFNRLMLSFATVYFYDRVLTFGQEVNCLWLCKKKRWIVPTLYIALHVSTALYLLLHIAPQHNGSFEPLYALRIACSEGIIAKLMCNSSPSVYWTMKVAMYMVYLIPGVVSSARAYAVTGGRFIFPTAVMGFSLVPIATNIYDDSVPYEISPIMILVKIATRLSLVMADFLVLMATWRATGGLRMITHGDSDRALLTRRLFRDGTSYFCVIFLANIATTIWAVMTRKQENIGNIAILADILTTVLLSRLLLNLREAAVAPPPDSTCQTTMIYAQTHLHSQSSFNDTAHSHGAAGDGDPVCVARPAEFPGHTTIGRGGGTVPDVGTDTGRVPNYLRDESGPTEEYLGENVRRETDLAASVV